MVGRHTFLKSIFTWMKPLELEVWKWSGIQYNQGSASICNYMCFCNKPGPPCLTGTSSVEWPWRSSCGWGLLLWVQIHSAGVLMPLGPLSSRLPDIYFSSARSGCASQKVWRVFKCRWTIWEILNCGLIILLRFYSIINVIFLTFSFTPVEPQRLRTLGREPPS